MTRERAATDEIDDGIDATPGGRPQHGRHVVVTVAVERQVGSELENGRQLARASTADHESAALLDDLYGSATDATGGSSDQYGLTRREFGFDQQRLAGGEEGLRHGCCL